MISYWFKTKRLISFSFLLLFGLLVITGCSQNKKVAVIDGEKIPLSYFTWSRKSNFDQLLPKEKREKLDEFYKTLLRAHDAEERGLQNDPTVKYKIILSQNSNIIRALYFSRVVDKFFPDSKVRNTYEKMKEARRVSRLLVNYGPINSPSSPRSRDQALTRAENIRKEILKEDTLSFEEAVKLYSDDMRTKDQGGDVGYLNYLRIPPIIADQIWKMSLNEISKPIDSPDGFFLLHLTGVDTTGLQSYDKEKQIIKNTMARGASDTLRSMWETLRNNIVKETHSKINDDSLKALADNIYSVYDTVQDKEDPDWTSMLKKINFISPGTYYGEPITKDLIDDILHVIGENQKGEISSASLLKSQISYRLQNSIISRYAREHHIEDYDKTAYELRWGKDQILDNYYKQHIVLANFPPSEDTLRAFYQRGKLSRYSTPDSVRVREIYVSSKSKANELKDQLDNGANFSDLARKNTMRPGYSEKAGDLGWFAIDRYGAIGSTADSMETGEIAGPIRVGTGWSVIKLIDKKPGIRRSFKEVKKSALDDYISLYRPLRLKQNIQSLEKKYNSEIYSSALQNL